MDGPFDDKWWHFFEWRLIMCPVTVTWTRRKVRERASTTVMTWRNLYIFGLRVVRWRVSDD
jgi:hypothetical protein